MFDQLLGLVLIGLGIQSPNSQPAVKGVQYQLAKGPNSGSGGSNDAPSSVTVSTSTASESHSGPSDATGASGARVEARVTGADVREVPIGRVFQRGPTGSSGMLPKFEGRKTMRDELRLELKEGKDVYRARFAEHREEFENEIEANHEAAKEKFEIKKVELEKKLQTFKDSQRKLNAENLQTKIADLNSKLIQNATERIGKISALLDEIVAKKASVNMTGKDGTPFDAAVTAAQTAILAAQDALSVQSAKIYAVSITSESTVKSDFGVTLKALNADRKVLNDAVVAARKSVSAAIQELAKLRNEEIPESVIK